MWICDLRLKRVVWGESGACPMGPTRPGPSRRPGSPSQPPTGVCGPGSAVPRAEEWTKWTAWTSWTRNPKAAVHNVHGVHFVHFADGGDGLCTPHGAPPFPSSAAFGAGGGGTIGPAAYAAGYPLSPLCGSWMARCGKARKPPVPTQRARDRLQRGSCHASRVTRHDLWVCRRLRGSSRPLPLFPSRPGPSPPWHHACGFTCAMIFWMFSRQMVLDSSAPDE